MPSRLRALLKRFRAIIFIVSLSLAGLIGITLLFNLYHARHIQNLADLSIRNAEQAYQNIRQTFIDTLASTMESVLINHRIAAAFAERDRDELYRLSYPLFQLMKKQSKITHWYYLDPEPRKTCFLRVHNRRLHGDVITRHSFDKAVATKQLSSGIDLGKTAFAIRVVHPFYFDNRLIGYLEMGIDMEYFFDYLKIQTGSEFSVIADKRHLVRSKWESIARVKTGQMAWDTYPAHLVISSTSPGTRTLLREIPFRISDVPDGGHILSRVRHDPQTYIRGVFPIYDAGGAKVAAAYVVKDISLLFNTLLEQKALILMLLFFLMALLTILMIYFHKRAENELRRYRFHLEDMIGERSRQLEEQFNARVEAEKKQSEAVKMAEQSARLASIGVMAAGITHEINQPLNVIKVTADSIRFWSRRNPDVLPQSLASQLNNISSSVNRIVEIIQHMRRFWVVPESPEVTELDLNRVVANAVSLVRQQLKAHNITHSIEQQNGIPPVRGNPIHFEQILINIISNAIHSLDETARQDKRLRLSIGCENGMARLEISDNGTGLATDKPDQLFDPFYSTRSDGRGMGLGLAIVKKYVDRYDGRINAKNNAQGGATFTLFFPLIQSEEMNHANSACR